MRTFQPRLLLPSKQAPDAHKRLGHTPGHGHAALHLLQGLNTCAAPTPTAPPLPDCCPPAPPMPQIKGVLMRSFGFHDNVYCHLAASLCAGFLAVAAGSPFDVVKSRAMGGCWGLLPWQHPAAHHCAVFLPLCSPRMASSHRGRRCFSRTAFEAGPLGAAPRLPCSAFCAGRLPGGGPRGAADAAPRGAPRLLERLVRKLRPAGVVEHCDGGREGGAQRWQRVARGQGVDGGRA